MMDMDAIVRFMRMFIKDEYEATVSYYTDRDAAAFQRKKARVEKHLAADVQSGLERSDSPDEQWFTTGREMVDSGMVTPRVLFQIKAYQHPTLGLLYRAYTSSIIHRPDRSPDYAATYFITTTARKRQIVSRYDLDTLPQDGPRLNDRAVSWILQSGLELETLGELIEVHRIEAPTSPAHRVDYEDG